MLLIFACAYGLRTKATCSMFGRSTSSTYNPCPVSRRGSSFRLILSPKYRVVIKTSIYYVVARSFVATTKQSPDILRLLRTSSCVLCREERSQRHELLTPKPQLYKMPLRHL